MELLPNEIIWHHILPNLILRERQCLSRVNKRFYRLIHQANLVLWKYQYADTSLQSLLKGARYTYWGKPRHVFPIEHWDQIKKEVSFFQQQHGFPQEFMDRAWSLINQIIAKPTFREVEYGMISFWLVGVNLVLFVQDRSKFTLLVNSDHLISTG